MTVLTKKDEKRLDVIPRVYRSELTVLEAARVMDSASASVCRRFDPRARPINRARSIEGAQRNHPAMTHQERKEILGCLIDHIVVGATKEKSRVPFFGRPAPKHLFSSGAVPACSILSTSSIHRGLPPEKSNSISSTVKPPPAKSWR